MPSYSTDLDKELEEMARRELNGDRQALTRPTPSTSAAPVRLDHSDRAFPQEDKNIAVGVHLGSLIGMFVSGGAVAWLIPLIAYFTTGARSEMLKDHIKNQLNFQITMLLVAVVGIVVGLGTLGFGFIIAAPVILMYVLAAIWGGVKGAIAASNGEEYEYPLAHKFLK